MANITRRGGSTPQTPSQYRDPMQMMRELLRWDPFGEMLPSMEPGLEQFMPQFEVKETKDAYVFKADLPGISEDQIDISLTGNRLTVSGRRESEERREDERFYAYERSYGSFSRSFTLPEGVDSDNVRASMDKGVLSVEIPKKPEAQPKKITVGEPKQERKAKA